MQTIADIFSAHGALARLVQDYHYRHVQEKMARAILKAIEQGRDLICEAGTGTGKTLAYLIPALLAKQKTIISTGTRHLQDQLNEKDLPVVREALKIPVTTKVLKGRGNYLCLFRMESALNDATGLSRRQLTSLQKVSSWSSSTETGDINELSVIAENTAIKSMITSTTENCLGQACSEYAACFVFKNRKAALEADLVITNHHLLLADMGLRESGFGEVLPLADTIIFDEAHQLPELASLYFSRTLSSRQLFELITDTQKADRKEARDIQELDAVLSRFEKSVRDVRLAFGRRDNRLNWQDAWAKAALPDGIDRLLKSLQALIDILEANSERGKLLEQCFQRAKYQYDYIENYIDTKTEETIRWVEVRGRHIYLNQTPVDIAQTFQQRLATYKACNIFTSATLAVNEDFSHFNKQLGFDNSMTEVWDSPFDYQRQTKLYLPLDLPAPNQTEFLNRFIDRTLELLSFSAGHAFVLFTSHSALAAAAEIIKHQISYPLFIQGEAPRHELLNRFRLTKHAVLLGTNSFWEGVDVKGEALSLVIIEKLPFASPDDPVLQARLNYLAKQGGNPFMEYQVPQAAIMLKQGTGRLIRDVNDKGVCVICDKRIVNKAYGKHLIKSLPPMPVTHELEDVKKFFA